MKADGIDDPVISIHKSSHNPKLANSRAQPEYFSSNIPPSTSAFTGFVLIDTGDYNISYFGTSGSLLEISRFRCGSLWLSDLVELIVIAMINHSCLKLISQLGYTKNRQMIESLLNTLTGGYKAPIW